MIGYDLSQSSSHIISTYEIQFYDVIGVLATNKYRRTMALLPSSINYNF